MEGKKDSEKSKDKKFKLLVEKVEKFHTDGIKQLHSKVLNYVGRNRMMEYRLQDETNKRVEEKYKQIRDRIVAEITVDKNKRHEKFQSCIKQDQKLWELKEKSNRDLGFLKQVESKNMIQPLIFSYGQKGFLHLREMLIKLAERSLICQEIIQIERHLIAHFPELVQQKSKWLTSQLQKLYE